MRYFKYRNTNKNKNNALKEQYKALTKDEQRTVRKEKVWNRFSLAVTYCLYFLFVCLGVSFIIKIPMPSNVWLESIVFFCIVLMFLVLLIISGLLTYFLTAPLWKKALSFNLPSMRKEIFSKACSHLRDYYGLSEPYIVTKCFDSSDEKFIDHDVCIFVVRDELRITADIQRGFLYGERDLGCYSFKRDEITLIKHHKGKRLFLELNTGNAVFTLGYRAKSFIEKNFIYNG